MRNDGTDNNLATRDREEDDQNPQRSKLDLISDVERTDSLRSGEYPKAFPGQPKEFDRKFDLDPGSASPAPCPFCCVILSAASWK